MPWTLQQIESFPCLELRTVFTEGSAEKDLTRRREKAIQGWKQFIVPHTPSESDIISRGILPDPIAHAVNQTLGRIIQGIRPSEKSDIKRMVAVWPTIWIWIRLLNERAIQVRKISSPVLLEAQLQVEQSTHRVLIGALLFFLGYDDYGIQPVSNELTTVVKGTDGVLQMIAASWIEETRDVRDTMGFQASKIYHESLSHYRPEFERLVIASCGGATKEVAKIAFNRISHNLHRMRCQHPSEFLEEMCRNLGEDILYVRSIFDDPSSALCASFKAHPGWVTLLVDVISYLLAPHHPPEKFIVIHVAMSTIVVHISINSAQCYGGLVELLESHFLDLISRPIPGQIKQHVDNFEGCCAHLAKTIYRYSVYRSIMCKTERCLRAIEESAWMKGSDTPAPTIFLDLREKAKFTAEAYKDFRGGLPPIFCCGNKECKSTDSGEGLLYRCRGCRLALYCSADCQKKDWRGTHRFLCKAMKQPGQAFPPQSSPDLRWLANDLASKFIVKPFPHSGFTACDSAGQFTSLLMINRDSQTTQGRIHLDLTTPQTIADTGLIPSGRLWEALHRSLSPRQSGHTAGSAPHVTQTVAVMLALPPHTGETPASITALLTFPAMETVLLEEVHVTWVFHQ